MRFNFIKTVALAITLLTTLSAKSAEQGTEALPHLLKCDTCYSISDFEKAAKRSPMANSADYFFVYNMKTKKAETVYSYSLYEPEIGLAISESYVVSTKPNHWESFINYLNSFFGNPKPEPKFVTIQLPGTYFHPADQYYPDIKRELLNRDDALFLLEVPLIITVQFGDLTVAIFNIPEPKFSNGGITLMKLFDKEGKDITPGTGSGSTSGGSSGSSGGSSGDTFTIPDVNVGGGTIMCFKRITAGGLAIDCKRV